VNNTPHHHASPLSLRLGVLLVTLAFAVALAVIVGRKMNTEAMAILIGIVCGAGASIPTTALLVVLLLRRERRREEDLARQSQRGAYPPVVVIQGGVPQAMPLAPQGGYWPAPVPAPALNRQFHVVGGDDLLLEE
jgi:hypothetical protein